MELSLDVGRDLTVSVQDEGKQPIARATVLVRGGPSLPQGTLADARGVAELPGVPAGELEVQVSARGYETVTRRSTEAALTVTLRRLGGVLVTVVDEEGRPAPSAEVDIGGAQLWPPHRVQTDASGTVRIAGLLSGAYDLRANRGEDVSDVALGVEVASSKEVAVTLELHRGRRVTVEVVDGSTSSPAPLADADVVLAEGGLGPFPLRGRTATDGKVVLGPIARGEATVSVALEGWVGAAALSVPEEDAPVVRAVLVRGGTVVGEVVDELGRPVPGASVEIVGTDQEGLPIAETPGTRAVRAGHFEWAMGGLPVLQPAGELGVMPGPVPPIPRAWGASEDGIIAGIGGWSPDLAAISALTASRRGASVPWHAIQISSRDPVRSWHWRPGAPRRCASSCMVASASKGASSMSAATPWRARGWRSRA